MDQVLKQATMKAALGDHSGTLAFADGVGLKLQDTIDEWCAALKSMV